MPLSLESSTSPIENALYVVATPIGNLEDISFRAVRILKQVDWIACEDTRTASKLLQHLGIERPLVPYHEHNEVPMAGQLAERLLRGEKGALIADAGTPTLSDPGFRVVRECRRMGIRVIPIPGPCALIAALSASGLPTHAFAFHGFLPPKQSARQRFFEEHRQATMTLILYESCHRIDKFLHDLLAVSGPERIVGIAREITKIHETFIVGPLAEVIPQIKGNNLKGEFVVLIAPESFRL